ncbi:MAG: argininosuccinate lyase, partial [Methanosarcinales archaeon]|nr:argininosuccinate lyase [Methanosarcinales archaeon]
ATGLSTIGLTEEMVEDALDPMKNIEQRNIIGGPAPQEIERAIGQGYKHIEKHSAKHQKLASKVDEALDKLNNIVNKKIGDRE